MSKFTEIKKAESQQLRKAINVALKEALKDLGVKVDLGNMTFTGSQVSAKLTIRLEDHDHAQGTFNIYCFRYGLKRSDWKAPFTYGKDKFEISGIRPRATRRPILGRKVGTNDIFTFPITVIEAALRKERNAA